jgi:uncharacterized membrane protein YeaQ/YmgE (transglycosylase-associated protein family)
VLILAILGLGALVGAVAQFIVGREKGRVDWGMAIIAGIAGSFVGGLIASLVSGDGLDLRASGVIGSIVGAVIVTAIWQTIGRKKRAAANAAAKAAARSGRHH